MRRRWALVGTLLVVALAAALATYSSRDDSGAATPSTIPQATAAQLEAAELDKLRLAPPSARVDVDMPTFSNPTNVTNPLFPIGNLRSTVLAGTVDGKSFKTETTLLPETRVIEWPKGRRVETLVSQYVAYLDGRIEEVALDYYAQADDGSVWYFGEDVFNYADGVIADTGGTWLAGKEGPAAMIMPAHPRVGDVYRSENTPGLVFEEITIKTVDKTVSGPHGPVPGAIVADELHQDGGREDKIFAPGYGEFFTGGGGDVEAMALAVPADKRSGQTPPELETLSTGADAIFDHQAAAAATVRRMERAWKTLRAGGVPPRLAARMGRSLAVLARAVDARDAAKARTAAIAVAQDALDLRLRYRPPAEIDRARFELWARQLIVDARTQDAAGARADVAALEWIRDRIAPSLDKVDVIRIDSQLLGLRAKVNDEDLTGAAASANALRATLASL